MGKLRFTSLGLPEVRHADQVLLFSTRKELALLIYLAVEGRVHLRKNLSEQFWPEGDAMHGQAPLQAVIEAEQMLEEMHKEKRVEDFLEHRDRQGYGYGLFIAAEPRGELVYHVGHIDGFFTYNGFYPESKLSVVVLINLETTNVLQIGRKLASMV